MATQEVILKFKADTSEIETSVKRIEEDLRKVDDKKIEPISKDSVANIEKASKGINDLGKAADTASGKSKSLGAQLKEMKAELNALEIAGKQNTEQFRKTAAAAGQLEDQIGGVNSRVKALASSTPKLDAMISAATGIAGGFSVAQGAVSLFGDENEELSKALLKVQAAMAITNGLQAVAQTLNKDSAFSVTGLGVAQKFLNKAMNAFPLIFIITALAAVAGGLFLLFTNQKKAADGILNFSDKLGVMGRISLGIATLGMSELVISVAKLSKEFRSNEEAAHDAAVTAASEFLSSTQKQIDAIQKTRAAVQGRYDFEIRLAKASGKDTEQIERDKLTSLIKSLDQEYAIRLAQAERVKATLIDNGVGATARLKSFADQQATDLKQALQNEKENLLVFNAEQLKIDEDAAKKSAEAGKDAKEKALQNKLAALDLERKETEKKILETAVTEEQANDMRNQANVDFIKKRIAILQDFGKGIVDEEINLLNAVQKIEDEVIADRLKAEKEAAEKQKTLQEKGAQQTKDFDQATLEAMEEGTEKQKAFRIDAFEKKILELEEQGVLTADLEKKLQEALFKDLADIDEKENKDRRDRLIKEIEQRKMLIDAGIKVFSDGINIISDLIKLSNLDAAQAAEFQKTLAVFQVGLDLAKSLATVISSATQAAAATGPLAPITLAGYIASGIAAITGAFVQVKSIFDAPVPKPAAKGDEYVTGGQWGKDSVLYNLMPGERVVTTKTNSDYWDELHAMHNGYYDQLISMKYIQPAIQDAMSNSGGMNNNIMGSIMLNGGKWKGQNIVGVLNQSAKQQKKQHKEMVEVLKPRRNNLRKF